MDVSEGAWLLANDHLPEYYIRRWQEGDDEKVLAQSSCSTGLRSSSPSKYLVALDLNPNNCREFVLDCSPALLVGSDFRFRLANGCS